MRVTATSLFLLVGLAVLSLPCAMAGEECSNVPGHASNCALCRDITYCHQCRDGYFLYTMSGDCGQTCPDGYTPNASGVCDKQGCPDGTYKTQDWSDPQNPKDVCLNCDPASQCKTCGNGSTRCSSCPDTMYLTPEKKCVAAQSCPEGTVADAAKGICRACNWDCKSCTETSTKCTECTASSYRWLTPSKTCEQSCPSAGFFQPNPEPSPRVCQACDASCATCWGAGPGFCSTCPAGKLLAGVGKNLSTGTPCVAGSDCPSKTYANTATGQCDDCPLYCSECDSSGKCTKCNDGMFFVSDNTCNGVCPDGTFANKQTKTCDPCDKTKCERCTDNATTCTMCALTLWEQVPDSGYSGDIIKTCIATCPDGATALSAGRKCLGVSTASQPKPLANWLPLQPMVKGMSFPYPCANEMSNGSPLETAALQSFLLIDAGPCKDKQADDDELWGCRTQYAAQDANICNYFSSQSAQAVCCNNLKIDSNLGRGGANAELGVQLCNQCKASADSKDREQCMGQVINRVDNLAICNDGDKTCLSKTGAQQAACVKAAAAACVKKTATKQNSGDVCMLFSPFGSARTCCGIKASNNLLDTMFGSMVTGFCEACKSIDEQEAEWIRDNGAAGLGVTGVLGVVAVFAAM